MGNTFKLRRKRKIHKWGTGYLKLVLNNFRGKINKTDGESRPFESQEDKKGYRSSHQRCFLENTILKKFAKITRKHLCHNLFFNRFIKKRLRHSCLRTPSLQNTSGRLSLKVLRNIKTLEESLETKMTSTLKHLLLDTGKHWNKVKHWLEMS